MDLQRMCVGKIPQLIEYLYGDFPRSAPLVGKLIQMGRSNGHLIHGNLYVDCWPCPQIIVLENLTYKRKDEVQGNPILFYTRCSKATLQEYMTTDKLLSSATSRELAEFQDTTYDCVEVIETIAHQHGLHIQMFACPYIYWLPDAVEISTRSIPQGYHVSRLQPCHVDYINTKWKFGSSHLIKRLQRWVEFSFTAAVFSSQTNEVVAWGLVGECGCISSLQTLEPHRGKGLAKIVTSQLVLLLRAANMKPFAYIENENLISQNLFEGLGFEKCSNGQVTFFTLEK